MIKEEVVKTADGRFRRIKVCGYNRSQKLDMSL